MANPAPRKYVSMKSIEAKNRRRDKERDTPENRVISARIMAYHEEIAANKKAKEKDCGEKPGTAE